jgi:hypothetical protein
MGHMLAKQTTHSVSQSKLGVISVEKPQNNGDWCEENPTIIHSMPIDED